MDIEFISRDLSDMLAGNPPYNTSISSRTSRVGFNWADVGVVTPPSNIYSWNCIMTNANYAGMSIVGICFKGTLAMSLSGNGKYKTASYNILEGAFVESSSYNNTTFYKESHSHNGENFTILYMSYVPTESKVSQPNSLWTANDDSFIASPSIPAFNQTTYNPSLGIRDAIENFLFPSSSFSFDATIDSESLGVDDDNASFTVLKWMNLHNMPSDHKPADYNIAVKIASHVTPIKTQLFTNKDETLEFTYEMLYNNLNNTQEMSEADANGYIDVSVFIYHARPGIVDAYHTVRVYPNGNMTLLYETAPGHLTVNPNTSPYFNGVYRGGTGTLIQQVPGQEMSVDNLLTISYAMDDNDIKAFGAWIWENSNPMSQLNETQVAPIENVISCKRIPFAVPNIDDVQKIDVHCGNQYVEVSGTRLQAYPALSTHRCDVGVFQIPVYSGDYLDFENNVSIYLPYVGIQSIPTSLCYKRTLKNAKNKEGNNITDKDSGGHTYTVQVPEVTGNTLGVVYYYDIVYGSCCALLYIGASWDSTNSVVTGGNLIAVFNGDCGVDIPITASNRASNELALRKTGDNMLTGVVAGAVGGAMAGGLVGALAGALTAGIGGNLNYRAQERNQEIHYTTSGGFSSQVASYMTKTVTLFVEHSTYDSRVDDPETYGHENGYPCNLSMKMRSLRGLGYSELSGEIEISGDIPCYEEERLELKKALTEGFYVSTNKIVNPPETTT